MRRSLLCLLLLVPATLPAQELAHPGWRGNAIAPQLWWKHARFVEFDPQDTLAGITKSLDLVSGVGADSILLPAIGSAGAGTSPIDPRFGTENDLETLLSEAGARHMHVILQASLSSLTGSSGTAAVRFWMNNGIAGFDLGTIADDAQTHASLAQLHSQIAAFPGSRILMGTVASVAKGGSDPLAIHIVRPGVSSAPASGVTAVEVSAPGPQKDALADALTLLFATGQPILDAHMLTDTTAMKALREVLALRSSNPAFQSGDAMEIPLGVNGATAWLCRPSHPSRATPPMLVLVNRTDQKVPVAIEQQVRKAGVRATFVRAELRTDGGMGSIDLEHGTLAPHSAVVGELRF